MTAKRTGVQKSNIHIDPKNKGKFTQKAKNAGQGVQEYANTVLADKSAPTKLKKEAQFAKNFGGKRKGK